MQANFIITHPSKMTCLNMQGLLILLDYARQHRHSYQWVGAILTILQRQGVAHG